MKTMTIRLPDQMAARIERESERRGISKSDVVRERLQKSDGETRISPLESIADLIGSVDGLPTDLSARKKAHLRSTGYGRKHAR